MFGFVFRLLERWRQASPREPAPVAAPEDQPDAPCRRSIDLARRWLLMGDVVDLGTYRDLRQPGPEHAAIPQTDVIRMIMDFAARNSITVDLQPMTNGLWRAEARDVVVISSGPLVALNTLERSLRRKSRAG